MLQQDRAEDFVIATGKTVSLQYFAERTFSYYGLDWQQYVESDTSLFRPYDIQYGRANPTKAKQLLGWNSAVDIDGVIKRMCDAVF